MDRGLYAATSGGLQSSRRLDIVANNLANVNTPGFKAQRIRSRQQSFEDTLASALPQAQDNRGDFERVPGVVGEGTFTDFTPGPVENTGNPLNAALVDPSHFFVVITPQGEQYTRAGNFTLNAENELVTPDGMRVSGGGGPIAIPPGVAPRILDNGTIVAGGQVAGQLQVVKVNDLQQLERTEGTRFNLKGGGTQTLDTPSVIPESVEMANVSTVDAMIDMINAQKGFEAYTKTAKTFDEMNERSIRNARIQS